MSGPAGRSCTVVTGVSQGLGSALFDALCDNPGRVVALGRRFTGGQRQLQRSSPDRVVLHYTDLADASTLPAADRWPDLLAGARHLTLIHNAAVIDPIGAIGTLSPSELVRAVAVNLTAPMLLTNSLLAAAATAELTVLFISSSAAHRVGPGRSVYSATKRGGETFFEGLAAQFADDHRVRAVSIDPGIMDTPMQAVIRARITAGAELVGRDRYLALHERGELPDPAGVARRIVADHLSRHQKE